ncbi:hypothetical protein MUP59_08100, partial [Candidatus Bathyarchaeota archaeon]|nr:hypothetical protein [Candidatus Bathyarchaeota archaeon]
IMRHMDFHMIGHKMSHIISCIMWYDHMVSSREIAEEIVEVIRANNDIMKNKLIQKVREKLKVGSSTVTDVLSQLYALKVVDYTTIQKAKVYCVNEKNLGELETIKD